MSKLPVIKDRQLIKALRRLGFFEHRQRGTSHLIMVHSDGRRTTVPIHHGKDIGKKTLKGIINDLDLTTEEFVKILQGK